MTKVILIVDPFSTGKLYAKAFSELGYHCYAVLSSDNVPDYFKQSFDPHYFQDKKLFSVEQIKALFSPMMIKAVVIGAETGVEVGEALAEYFNVEGNSAKSSAFRRDKFAMQQQLKSAGLNYIESHFITVENKRLPDFDSVSGYILKPLNSAGSEGVIFCQNSDMLAQQIQQIEWGKVNVTGNENRAFLVQPFIQGTEFVVDMVVENRQIYTVSICRYRKGEHNQSRFVYEYMEMLDPQDYAYRELVDYAHRCATALEFTFGAVHMEIMQSPMGYIMIEAGARLHGGIAPQVFQHCYRPDLLTQAVSCYVKNAIPIDTQLIKPARVVFMINTKENANVDRHKFKEHLNKIASVVDVVYSHTENLPLTVDLLTCPVLISLVANDQAQIEEETALLRTLFDDCLS